MITNLIGVNEYYLVVDISNHILLTILLFIDRSFFFFFFFRILKIYIGIHTKENHLRYIDEFCNIGEAIKVK